MLKVNACGMGCPQPVLMTKNAIAQSPNEIEITVDNNTAKGNVERFLKNAGYKMDVKEEDETFIISAKK